MPVVPVTMVLIPVLFVPVVRSVVRYPWVGFAAPANQRKPDCRNSSPQLGGEPLSPCWSALQEVQELQTGVKPLLLTERSCMRAILLKE